MSCSEIYELNIIEGKLSAMDRGEPKLSDTGLGRESIFFFCIRHSCKIESVLKTQFLDLKNTLR